MDEGVRMMAELRASGQSPRLRTYLPLLEAFVDKADVTAAFSLIDEMKSIDIEPGERE